MFESVQKIMTKPFRGLRNFPHKDRLKRLNLHSVERRRVQGDLVEGLK